MEGAYHPWQHSSVSESNPPTKPDPWSPPETPDAGVRVRVGIAIAALLLAVIGAIGYFAGFGWGVSIGGPFAVGLFSAWLAPPKVRLVIGLALVALVPFGFAITFAITGKAEEAGVGMFCGLIAIAVLAPGYLLGYGAGRIISRIDKKRVMELRTRIALPIGVPIAVQCAQLLLGLALDDETVSASRFIPAPPSAVWQSSNFRGESAPEARWPFRLGMTRAHGKEGHARAAGDEKTYFFRKGHIRIRVTESAPPERLAFEVVEQQNVEDRAARFRGGMMRFTPEGIGTRADFSLTYAPLMTPRWLWWPVESWAAEAVLEETLERMDASVPSMGGPEIAERP